MKPLLIVANFKSNFTLSESKNWLSEFASLFPRVQNLQRKIVLCPSFTLLPLFREFTDKNNLPFDIGAQNISSYPEGPHTGEVNGLQIKDFANYVLVGHSERKQFGEDESVISEKLNMARDYNLTPILCVQDETQKNLNAKILAYEPIFAIGSGNPDTPENAQRIGKILKTKYNISTFLYGGSVDMDNVNRFTAKEEIDGTLVGHSSLDPESFIKLIENA